MQNIHPKILIVDDSPENLKHLRYILADLDAELVFASSGEEALEIVPEENLALILLDIKMPGWDGFDVAARLRERESTRTTPIIFMTAFSIDAPNISKGYGLGAIDFIFLPVNQFVLSCKVKAYIDIYNQKLSLHMDLEKTRSEAAKFKAIFNSISDAIVFVDPERRIKRINKAFTHMFGYKENELIGETTAAIYASKDDYIEQGNLRFKESAKTVNDLFENEFRRKDGSIFPVEVLGCQVVDSNDDLLGFIGVIRDISEKKELKDNLFKVNEQLKGKVKTLEEFVYLAAHDLRSPLFTIESFTDILNKSAQNISRMLDKSPMPSEMELCLKPHFEDIETSVNYIKTAVKDSSFLLKGLLDISKVSGEDLNKQTLHMPQLVSELLTNYENQTKAGKINISVSTLPDCMGDYEQVVQVFRNLIENAIKYVHPKRDCVIHISGRQEHDKSVYCVEDNGCGIAKDYHENIFKMFSQLEKTSEGYGIGLSIAKKIIERHKGKIWLESEVGKGSKFYISL